MSKPRYPWWGYARNMIRLYPTLCRGLQDLHAVTVTANLSAMPKGGGNSRSVESTALRQLPGDARKMHEAVAGAVEALSYRPDGEERLCLIRLMYWGKKPMSMKSAALNLHISDRTAKRWHGEFVRLVGKCYGFEVDTLEPK